jgi:hypothetical protein
MHAHQVAIEDAVLDHRVTLDPQHVIRHPGEDRRVEQQAAVHLGIGTDRRPRRHPAEDRNVQQLGARRLPEQTNASGLMRIDFDKTGFGQRQHMLARHAAGGETKGLADFSEARGLTVLRDSITDKRQDGSTAGS